MNTAEASAAVIEFLACAEGALATGDTPAASLAMQGGADLCTQLQAAGIALAARDLAAIRERFDRCGRELERLTRELQSDSAKGENLRRGLASYESRR